MKNKVFYMSLILIAVASISASLQASPPKTAVTSYDIVTTTKPVALATYIQLRKGVYTICVGQAKLLKLPVQAFPATPTDFFTDRVSFIRDGENYSIKKETYSIEVEPAEKQCASSFKISTRMDIYHTDKMQTTEIIADGTRSTETQSIDKNLRLYTHTEAAKSNVLLAYSLRQNKNGLPLRCADNSSGGDVYKGLVTCVYDGTSEGSLFDAEAQAIQLYSYVPSASFGAPHDSSIETVVTRFYINTKIDSALFKFK
jgi:hypothetical protein